MKSVLITGANRGLGLGMVKHLTNKNEQIIIATCRNVSKELKELAEVNKRLFILNLDLTNMSSIGEISSQVAKILGDRGLNLLINNAGVTTKFTKLSLVKNEQLLDNLTVNTIAPIMLTKNLLPALKQAASVNQEMPMGAQRAAVVNMSSVLGSIGNNNEGGFYPYRCSKAALNAATKSMSIDLKKDNILVVSMHPGWVKTDMGGPNAPLAIDKSVEDVLRTIDNLGEGDTGKFLQFDGTELPW